MKNPLSNPTGRKTYFLAFSFLFFSLQVSRLHGQTASGAGPLFVSANTHPKTSIIVESNVVFPDLLGDCSEAATYMEEFVKIRRSYLISMHDQGDKWLPRVSDVFKQYQLPDELKVLIAMESAYQGGAVSRAGAVGYWQIMDEVAREYGMKYVPNNGRVASASPNKYRQKPSAKSAKHILKQRDDRKDFLKSTIVAARYLHDRRVNLRDNWLLVVASYNCGVGRVWKALDRIGNPDAGFWQIRHLLPRETQHYVMNFITLNVVFKNYEKFLNRDLRFRAEEIFLPENSGQPVSEEVGFMDIGSGGGQPE